MATAIIAGIAAYGAVAGSVATATAVAIGAAAAAATMIMEKAMEPDMPDQQAQVSLGDSAARIDKTALQKEADVSNLQLGESDDKKKRKKGKAAFKIALDKKQNDQAAAPSDGTGAQIKAPKELGAQL